MNRFNNISLKNILPKNDFLQTDFSAGSPPYVRGYEAMGHILNLPKLQPISFSSGEKNNTDNIFIDINSADFQWVTTQKMIEIAKVWKSGKVCDFHPVLIFENGENSSDFVAAIRAARMLWAKVAQHFDLLEILPIGVLVKEIAEVVFALSAMCDSLFYNIDNHSFDNKSITFLIKNSYLTKTIDPFAGSVVIEQKTINIYAKSCEYLAEMLEE